MNPLVVRLSLLFVAIGLAVVPLLVRVGRSDDATVQQAQQVCAAVAESRHAEAIAASEMLPPLDSEAARQVAECRCWALQRVGEAGRCTALLDQRLAGADERGSDWLPPAPLVRPVLRARLDRLNNAQDVAQVGATIGREFSYALVQAVSSLEDAALQQGLRQLVDADLVFQKGLPPQAQYVFKHALVQDTAYQSLLKSRRQRHSQCTEQ